MPWYHMLLDLHGCRRDALEDVRLVEETLRKLSDMMETRIIAGPVVVHYVGGEGSPSGQGVSGFVVVAESHIAIHTDITTDYVSVDVYSCKEFDQERVERFLVELFQAKQVERRFMVRGPGSLKAERTIGIRQDI